MSFEKNGRRPTLFVMLSYSEPQCRTIRGGISDLSQPVAIIYLLHLVGGACLRQRLKEVSIDILGEIGGIIIMVMEIQAEAPAPATNPDLLHHFTDSPATAGYGRAELGLSMEQLHPCRRGGADYSELPWLHLLPSQSGSPSSL